jgi:hypothetical protein
LQPPLSRSGEPALTGTVPTQVKSPSLNMRCASSSAFLLGVGPPRYSSFLIMVRVALLFRSIPDLFMPLITLRTFGELYMFLV